MELAHDEVEQLDRLIQSWLKYDTYELESNFGNKGVVDSNTFLQIAQRLRSKGFIPQLQEDYLNIITPNDYRFTLRHLGQIENYCRNDIIENTGFTVIKKDRLDRAEVSNLDLKDYPVRIKIRREVPIEADNVDIQAVVQNWSNIQKAFRLIRRWSFEGKGIRVDLSMVRQSPPNERGGGLMMAPTFQEHHIIQQNPRYEVEVELIRSPDTATAPSARSALIRGIGEILRAIQKNSLLITNRKREEVKRGYYDMMKIHEYRGVNPITLQVENMASTIVDAVPNIRSGYNVTDKADGLRAHGYINPEGELFLLDQSMTVYRTGLKNDKCAGSLVDGEWVTISKDKEPINHYLIFDIYHYDENDISALPFAFFQEGIVDQQPSRYQFMKEWFTKWNDEMVIIGEKVKPANCIQIGLKQFKFASAGNTSIFMACNEVLNTPRIYHTDGLILTTNTKGLPQQAGARFNEQFKWKPPQDNTIDFLIEYEKDEDNRNIDKITNSIQYGDGEQNLQYKTMRLYVGGVKQSMYNNPREIILGEQPIRSDQPREMYMPILFTPIEFPDTMANTSYVIVQPIIGTTEEYATTADSKEPIPDRSIVEMRYDPSQQPGWRWIPSRIRHDKTERLLHAVELAKLSNRQVKYRSMMNDEKVANSVWNSIHDPITDSMIRSGNEQPSDEEIRALSMSHASIINKKYYERKAPKESIALVKTLQNFHNHYIKSDILVRSGLSNGSRLIDLACGKGGDLQKWQSHGAKYVVGIDYAGENITNPVDGAYKRYMGLISKFGEEHVPRITFVIGDSSKRIITGEAGANQQEQDMLRFIFGREAQQGDVPPYVLHHMGNKFRNGADVAACMFALHYFFKDETTLDGFLTNLKETIKVGGLFIGCCFDGQLIFDLLANTNKGGTITGTEMEGDEEVPIWNITKMYDRDQFEPTEQSVGLGINVEFISIGSPHEEYLVSFEFLESKMKEAGFRLLNTKELAQLKLKNSTELFRTTYHQMSAREQQRYAMRPSVQQYSFLNRWFIFKREGEIVVEEALPEVLPEVPEALPELPEESAEAPSEASAEASVVASSAASAVAPSVAPKAILESVSAAPIRVRPKVASASASASAPVTTASVAARIEEEEKGDAKLPSKKVYATANLLYRFGIHIHDDQDVEVTYQGKIDEHIAKYMSLIAIGPNTGIPDADDPSVTYPSIEHYLAGMKLKHAGKKLKSASSRPDYLAELAKNLFSISGDIHEEMIRKRAQSRPPIQLDSERDYTLQLEETLKVRKMITDASLKSYHIMLDESVWSTMKDRVLHYALDYRFHHDKRFENGVKTIITSGRDLLYSPKDAAKNTATSDELGGERVLRGPAKGTIKGENKVGTMLMEIATALQ